MSEEARRGNDNSLLAKEVIKKIQDEFKYGSFVFTYYRYLDKFHVEPKSWLDLFEYIAYNNTENEINNAIKKEVERNNG